ncbi:uncharacterized protein LOC144292196 isoform X5 [Canis aureus]
MTQAHMSSGFQPGLPMGSHPLGIRKGKEDENVSVSEMTASMGGSREWNYYGDSTGFNTRFSGRVKHMLDNIAAGKIPEKFVFSLHLLRYALLIE